MPKLPKPQLHGLSVRRGLIWLGSAIVNGVLGGLAFQAFYINKKRKKYDDFYANYDIDKEFEKMRAKGLFTAC